MPPTSWDGWSLRMFGMRPEMFPSSASIRVSPKVGLSAPFASGSALSTLREHALERSAATKKTLTRAMTSARIQPYLDFSAGAGAGAAGVDGAGAFDAGAAGAGVAGAETGADSRMTDPRRSPPSRASP